MSAVMYWSFRLRTLLAVVGALLLGAVLIRISGANPMAAYGALFGESFFDYYGISNTLVKTSPILLAGLAVILPLRAGVYNIGGEGQIYLGGLFGTIAGLMLGDTVAGVGIPLVIAASVLGGALWGGNKHEAPAAAPSTGGTGSAAAGGCPPNSERLGGYCIPYKQTCSRGLAANAPPQSCRNAQEKLVCDFRADGLNIRHLRPARGAVR